MCKAFVKGLNNCGNPNGSRYHQKMALYTELYKNKDNEKLGAFANGQSQDGGDSASIMSSKSQPAKGEIKGASKRSIVALMSNLIKRKERKGGRDAGVEGSEVVVVATK